MVNIVKQVRQLTQICGLEVHIICHPSYTSYHFREGHGRDIETVVTYKQARAFALGYKAGKVHANFPH